MILVLISGHQTISLFNDVHTDTRPLRFFKKKTRVKNSPSGVNAEDYARHQNFVELHGAYAFQLPSPAVSFTVGCSALHISPLSKFRIADRRFFLNQCEDTAASAASQPLSHVQRSKIMVRLRVTTDRTPCQWFCRDDSMHFPRILHR